MADTKRISLCWYTKTPQGWRYFPVIMETVHRVKQVRHGWVKVREELKEYPQGRYVLRSYTDGRKVYTPVEECNPRDAVLALQRAQRAAVTTGNTRSTLALIRTATEAYIRDCQQRKAFEAAEQARVVLKEFAPLCHPIIHTRSITREHIFAFHRALRDRGCSARTVANKHARLKSFLRFCKVDTSFMPPAPKYELALPVVYSPEQIKAMREAAKKSGDAYMLVLIDMALKLGLREQELMYAEWDDVDVHHATFRVQGKTRKGADGKGWKFAVKDSEQRDVPIPSDLLTSLSEWHRTRPKTILILGNEQDRPEGHLLRKLKQLARNANLNCGKCDGCQREGAKQECEQFNLHNFRRTYLTMLLRNNVDLKTVQSWAGHSDLDSTMRYLRPAATSEMQGRVNAIKWE